MEVKCSKCKLYVKRDNACIFARNWKSKKPYYYCNPCNTKRCKLYRNKANNMDTVYKTNKRYRKKNKHKVRAWHLAKKIPLTDCESCGSDQNVHRHHEDYSKPLEVIMLCVLCHKKAHVDN